MSPVSGGRWPYLLARMRRHERGDRRPPSRQCASAPTSGPAAQRQTRGLKWDRLPVQSRLPERQGLRAGWPAVPALSVLTGELPRPLQSGTHGRFGTSASRRAVEQRYTLLRSRPGRLKRFCIRILPGTMPTCGMTHRSSRNQSVCGNMVCAGEEQCDYCGAFGPFIPPADGIVWRIETVPESGRPSSKRSWTKQVSLQSRIQANGTWAHVYRFIDRDEDEYLEYVHDHEGRLIRHISEALSEHYGRGSARRRATPT